MAFSKKSKTNTIFSMRFSCRLLLENLSKMGKYSFIFTIGTYFSSFSYSKIWEAKQKLSKKSKIITILSIDFSCVV